MKYIHKKSRKIFTRLAKGEAPPRGWFEELRILGTYVGWFSWMHYYFDGQTYRIYRTDEVELYNGDLAVGEVEGEEETEVAA